MSKLKSELSKLKFLMDSGKSEPATQQPVNRKMERVRDRAESLQKSWRVLSIALAFSCLEWCRDHSPLKRVLISGDWVGVARRKGLVPLPGQGTAALNRCSFI